MKPNKLAKLYSNILFECAKDMSVLDEVRDSISKIDNLVCSMDLGHTFLEKLCNNLTFV